MADAGEVKARATLDNAEFLKALKDMANSAETQTKAVTDQIEKMASGFGAVVNAVGKLGAISFIGDFAKDCLDASNAMAKLGAGFKALLGPSEETKAIFEELDALKFTSVYDFEETLGPAAKRMIELGVSGEQTAATMTALVDAAAGMKKAPEWITEVSDTIAKMNSHIVASQRDMKALQQEGIPAWHALAEEMGTSIPEAMAAVKKGLVTAQEVTTAVTAQMKEDWEGKALAAMTTFKGESHILDETVKEAMKSIGDTIRSVLNEAAPIIKMVSTAVSEFTEYWKSLPGPIKDALVIVPAVVGAFVGISAAVAGLQAAFTALEFNPVVLAISAVVAVLALLAKWAYENWPAIVAVFDEAVSYLTTVFEPLHKAWIDGWVEVEKFFSDTVGVLSVIFEPLTSAWTTVWEGIKSVVSTVWNFISPIFGAIVAAVTSNIKLIADLMGYLGVFSSISEELKKMGSAWDEAQAKMAAGVAATKAAKEASDEHAASLKAEELALNRQEAAELAAANAAKLAAEEKKKADAEAKKIAAEWQKANEGMEKSFDALMKSAEKLEADLTKAYRNSQKQAETTVAIVVPLNKRWGEATPIKYFMDGQTALKALGVTSETEYKKAVIAAEAHAKVVKESFENGQASAADYDAALAKVDAAERALADYTGKTLADAFKTLGVTSTKAADDTATAMLAAYADIAKSGKATETDLYKAWEAVKKAQQAAADNANKELLDAYHQLGVKSSAEMTKLATDSDAAYQKIAASAANSVAAKEAWIKKTQEANAAILQEGGALTEAKKSELARAQQDLQNHLDTSVSMWKTAYDGVKSTFNTAFDSMTDKLVTGKGSFSDILTNLWEGLAKTALETFLKPVQKAITDFIATTLADLLSGKGLGGVLDSLEKIGKAAVDVFTGGASGAASAAGGAGSAAGGAGSAAGGAGSSAAGAVGSGLAGIVGAVGSVVTAVSSIIGNFQMAHQESSLNSTDKNTLVSSVYLGERSDGGILGVLFKINSEVAWADVKANEDHRDLFRNWSNMVAPIFQGTLNQLTGMMPYIVDIKTVLEDIRDHVRHMDEAASSSSARSLTINISPEGLTTAEAARALGNQIAANLSTQMVPVA